MTRNTRVNDDQNDQFQRRVKAIRERLGKSLPFDRVMEGLQLIHDGEFPPKKQRLLRPVSSNFDFFINRLDGKETLAGAVDVFASVSPRFSDADLNRAGPSTPEVYADVFAFSPTGKISFGHIFEDIGRGVDDLCFSQAQITHLCRDHRTLLQHGHEKQTLFLTGEIGSYHVVLVTTSWGMPRVDHRPYDTSHDWGPLGGMVVRVIVPKPPGPGTFD